MTNVDQARFQFSQEQISQKTPGELGRYIAGMDGTTEQLEKMAGFVDALMGYDKTQGAEFRDAFIQARAQAACNSLSL
ncbi:hypothetical protein [Ponticoccus litoralis]|uniref:Uncharacterized protein n=1 Tax=Ponticoccus litoralis TaxID=422297 RepID=A0AAW9SR57_9RHOB